MNHFKASGLVLAVHPTSRGFGWALFEGPLAPVDWGIASAKGTKSAQCMVRFKQLLDQYHPSALVLEKFDDADTHSERLRTLTKTMRGFANNRDMDTPIYGKKDVSLTVTGDAKASRHRVAAAVAERFPILRPRLPEARKLWQSEDNRQCLFDAVALGITHYAPTRPHT